MQQHNTAKSGITITWVLSKQAASTPWINKTAQLFPVSNYTNASSKKETAIARCTLRKSKFSIYKQILNSLLNILSNFCFYILHYLILHQHVACCIYLQSTKLTHKIFLISVYILCWAYCSFLLSNSTFLHI